MADVHSIEVWEPIAGYEGRYEISNRGRVRSHLGRPQLRLVAGVRKVIVDADGYGRIRLTDETGRIATRKVHQLVTRAFIGPCPDGHEINHKDGIRNNNHIDNLEYVTRHGNMQHAVERRGVWGYLLTKPAARRAQTHCKRGHPYNEVNTFWTTDGRRDCRECTRARVRATPTAAARLARLAYMKAYNKTYVRPAKH